MLSYAESFGLILFVYILGLQVGPGFMSAFKQGGTKLNLLGVLLTLIGTFMALGIVWAGWVPLPDMMGVLCGSTTNTPALGAAQQTFKEFGDAAASSTAALGCAVTYPLGMVGVIIALIIMRGWLTRRERSAETMAKTTRPSSPLSSYATPPSSIRNSMRWLASARKGPSLSFRDSGATER